MNAPPVQWVNGSWETYEPWTLTVNGCTMTIPKGFRTDLASVPRLGWLFISPTELGGVGPPLAHDVSYRLRGRVEGLTVPPTRLTRRATDRIFLQLMEAFGVSRAKRRVAWAGVRLFGWVPWPPSKTMVFNVVTKSLHTIWQAFGGILVASQANLPLWTVPLIAAGLSAVKSALAPGIRDTVAGVLYR